MSQLTGKKTLVLGGSRGIGAAIVRRLASDGAQITFTYSGSRDAAQALAVETGASAVQADSADMAAVRQVVADQEAFDILVVNAGVASFGAITELEVAEIDRLIDINVRSAYWAAAEAAKRLRDNGRILFIGSVNGDRVPFAGLTAYSMSKSALQGLTRGLARELGERGITVNNVQPGPVDTDMNPAEGPLKEMLHAGMAIKRHARVEEVAGLVAYLAGPEAGMVTGAQHTIDGGFGA